MKEFTVTWVETRQVTYKETVEAKDSQSAKQMIEEDEHFYRSSCENIEQDELVDKIHICKVEETETQTKQPLRKNNHKGLLVGIHL
jgi:hypothetical protein